MERSLSFALGRKKKKKSRRLCISPFNALKANFEAYVNLDSTVKSANALSLWSY